MHPAIPDPAVVEVYYKDYLKDFPSLLNAGWGFTVETATLGIRLVLSGVFDAYPDVKIILGHLGESLPISVWRIDRAMSSAGNSDTSFSFRDYFCVLSDEGVAQVLECASSLNGETLLDLVTSYRAAPAKLSCNPAFTVMDATSATTSQRSRSRS